MKDAAAHRDQHIDHPTDDEAAPGPDWDPDWIYGPAERTDRIAAAVRENDRLFRLAVGALTLWQAELKVDGALEPSGEIASVVLGLLRCCELRGRLDVKVAEAFVTVAEALGVSRERLSELYREAMSGEPA